MDIDYDIKEEREVLSEAITKHFPLDSLKIIKRGGVNEEKIALDVKEFFDDHDNITAHDQTLYLAGNDGWTLLVEFNATHGTVKFRSLRNVERTMQNLDDRFCIFSCKFDVCVDDLFGLIFNFFIRNRYEFQLAKFLYKLYKEAYTRHDNATREEKCERLKNELLS